MDWTVLFNQVIHVMIWVCITGCAAIGVALLHEKRHAISRR